MVCQRPAAARPPRAGSIAMIARLLTLSVTATLAWPASAALGSGDPIMPLSQVHAGMDCTGETVIQGTTISSFNVHVIDVVRQPGSGPRILVRVSGPAVDSTGVAEGFSGSPVYCMDSGGTLRNAGAISQGIGEYGNQVVLVTPIEQMLGERVKPPSSAPRLTVRARPLLGPLTVGGLSPALLRVLQEAGRRAGRLVVAAPAGPTLGFPVQPLVPGASVAVSYSTGAIELGAVGTVTYRDGSTVYAFGHELDGAGRRSLLLQDAYVYDVVSNPNVGLDTSYKLAAPGHTLGTLTSDTPNAVIGNVGSPPTLIPVRVTARDLDTGNTMSLLSGVADETDVGLPLGTSSLDMIAPLEVGQAATSIFDGPPASESGQMCFRIDLRESRLPLQFCNRYVGTGAPGDGSLAPPELALATTTDVSTALGLLDQVQFEALHVTRVLASVTAQRGLAQGTIVAAHAPLRVKAGRDVSARLVVRVFRGPLRTLSFRIRIPPRAHGALTATIRGPSSQGQGGNAANSLAGLAAALSTSLGAGSSTSGPGPPSIAALRKAFDGIASYDGLKVGFGRGRARPVYRDPSLLINGHATLAFLVVR
jgi:hypothetical protein